MAFRVISVGLEANDARLTSAMRRAASSVDDFGRRTTAAARTSTRAGNEMTSSFSKLENVLSRGVTRSMIGFTAAATGGYAAGVALRRAIEAVVGGAVQLDTRMRNVNSISHLSEQQLGRLTGQVVDLSRVLPQSANTLAEGLYDIASSGFQGAEGIQVLTASARAASAGLTDTATSAAAIAGVLNAYGEGAGRARYVSDALFKTVDVGVLSFGDLAQGIGQVIGTAAAANVSVDELGQAIATMTKGGLIPAEAFTSANQLLAQIIQPGEALAALFHQLGYESGAAALQSKGLAGVMQDIQRATGGNITAMSQLFTDIRSLRGALPLVANDGKLYRGVIASWASAHEGAGATARALNEQMKSAGAQWQLFKNRVQAAAIETGQRLLPALIGALRGANEFGDGAANVVGELGGTFHNLAEAGISAAHVIGILASAAAPLVSILATVAVTPVIATLEALSAAAAGTVGFLERNKIALAAVATVLTAMLVPALGAAGARLAWFTANLAAAGILRAMSAITLLTGGISNLGTTLARFASIQNVATVGIAGITVALAAAIYSWQKAGQAASQFVNSTEDGLDFLDPKSVTATTDALWEAAGQAAAAGEKYKGAWGTFRAGWDALTGDADDVARRGKAAADAALEIEEKSARAFANVLEIARRTGLDVDEIIKEASRQNLGEALTGRLDSPKAMAARKTLIDSLHAMANEAGVSFGALADAAGGSIESMQAVADAVVAAKEKVAQAFAGGTDIITLFDPDSADQAVQDATTKLREAEQSLAELRARQDGKTTVSDTQQLAHARQAVADATVELNKAQADAANSTLESTYRRSIQQAREFNQQTQEALRRGLDPQLVQRLLEAGPEKAAPVLQALVADHSGRLIEMANRSEAALRRISSRVVEMARLTTLATTATTDTLSHDLPKASKLAAELAAEGGDATLRALTQAMHLSPSEIQRIAQEFGITLPRAVQRALDRNPVHVRVASPRIGEVHGGVFVPRGAATGGLMQGPGTGTSDSILARLSNGEYVMRAAAVAYYGVSTMAALNKMAMPRYATGGMVGSQPAIAGGSPRVVVVRVESATQHSVKHETNLHGPVFSDHSSWERFEESQRMRAVAP